MENGKRGKGQQGGMFQHPLMVRLAATEKSQLEWLSRQKQKAQGTLAREMITDLLGELLAPGTPLRQKYDRERASKRRNTPIERAARASSPANAIKLVPSPSPSPASTAAYEQTS